MKHALLVISVAGILGSVAEPSFATPDNLILNGSFENPIISTNSFQSGTPVSWSWSSVVGLIHNGVAVDPPSGKNWPAPLDQQQYIDIGNIPSIALTQVVFVVTAGSYTLQWYDNAHIDGQISPYSIELRDSSLGLVFNANLDAAHGGTWLHRSYTLAIVPDTYRLTFTAQGQSLGYNSLLDNVSLTSAVPENSTLFLVVAGICPLLMSANRRRAIPLTRCDA